MPSILPDLPDVIAAWQRAIEHPSQPYEIEHRIRRADGQVPVVPHCAGFRFATPTAALIRRDNVAVH